MKQLFSLFFLLVFISGLALAQAGDSEETLLEQSKALAKEQSGVNSVQPISFSVEAVTHPLFVGVDDVTVPAYVGDPVTVDWDSVFVGVEVWGAAYDIDNNKIYVNDGSDLYEWVVGSGTVTFLGTITDTSAATMSMVSLGFYNDVLYGTRNIGNEAVYEINTSTFVATVFIDYSETFYDFGGLAVDPNTGEFYGTSDDADSLGRGLYLINMDGTATLIAPYPDGQTDIDGLAFSDTGIAYLVTDQEDSIYIYDVGGGTYLPPIANPWTSSEVFCGGAWIYEAGGSSGLFPEVLYYTFDEAGSDSTENFAVPGSGDDWAQVMGVQTLGGAGQFGSALVGAGGTGTSDYVNTGWATDIGTSDWTISVWLNNLTIDFHYLFGDNTAGSWRSFMNGAAGTNNVILRGGGMADHVVAGVVPGPNVVHWVYDGVAGETRAYLNGVFVDAVVQSALDISGPGPFKVGGYSSSASLWAGALMDEFRLYNRALDDAEIAATWNITIVPVELTSFTASVNDNDVTLNWVTASEINNSGFQVERKSIGEYQAIGFVPGYGTTTETKAYSFSDANLTAGTYSYRLKQIDYDGTFEYSDPVEVDIVIPDVYSLHQNYPNPFNPTTNITFTLAANAKVTLKVFDVLGQEVMTLINQDLTAGVHTYDFNAAGFNSGVYFYRIEANGIDGTNFTNVKKMILLK